MILAKSTVLVLLLSTSNMALASSGFQSQIVGGEEADIHNHPYIVSMQTKSGDHYCGGSLISPDLVLTAAHCVEYSSPSSIKIVLGSQSHSERDSEAEVHSVKKITVHPLYENGWTKISHDYALLQLNTESGFEPVVLNSSDAQDHLIPGTLSTTLGWGITKEGGSDLSETLMMVDVPLVEQATCIKSYGDQIDDSMICAGFAEGGKDSCQGDSGGPLVVKTDDGHQELIGVVSWGHGCGRPQKYGVYSKVLYVKDWIDSNLRKL